MGFCPWDFPMSFFHMRSWHGPAYTPQIFQGMPFFNKKIKTVGFGPNWRARVSPLYTSCK